MRAAPPHPAEPPHPLASQAGEGGALVFGRVRAAAAVAQVLSATPRVRGGVGGGGDGARRTPPTGACTARARAVRSAAGAQAWRCNFLGGPCFGVGLARAAGLTGTRQRSATGKAGRAIGSAGVDG
eukprot:6799556-Prymnesium_polylepis.1